MSTPVRAAVVRGLGQPFTFEELTIDDPRPDEVLVKITAVGLCHTDLAVQHGDMPAAFPHVLGHEGAGVVVRTGAGVTGLHPGDPVVLSFAACGECRKCRAGHPVACRSFLPLNLGGGRADGSTALTDADGDPVHSHFFGQSSFASHAIVAARNVVKLPAGANLRHAGPLGCGFQTGAGTVLNTLDVPAGASIAVTGAGAVGLAAIMGAKVAGATTIIAVDVVPERLALAERFGATAVIDSRTENVAKRIRQLSGGGVDFAVDTTAIGPVIEALIKATAQDARIALIGVAKSGTTLDIGRLPLLGKTLIWGVEGDSIPQTFIPELLALQQAGDFPFDELITEYPFERLDEAIADTAAGTAVKAVLVLPKD